MGYETYIKGLLSPLGVYDLTMGSISGEELFALGRALDKEAAALERAERESCSVTAEEEGLDRREALFARRPAAPTTELRRAAIATLLQIGGDSFSLEAINRTISGCGIKALALELAEWGHIRVIFPEVAGEPEDYAQIRKIILDIIPCHLDVEFYLRYLTWEECEEQGFTWASVEADKHTWHSFELAV